MWNNTSARPIKEWWRHEVRGRTIRRPRSRRAQAKTVPTLVLFTTAYARAADYLPRETRSLLLERGAKGNSPGMCGPGPFWVAADVGHKTAVENSLAPASVTSRAITNRGVMLT